MAVRSLQQINQELDQFYNPYIKNVQQQQSLVPQQTEADIQQADAQKTQAFDEILGGARRRGIGFAGIPLGEQAKYASTVYAPEVLRARTSGRQRALGLEEALLNIGKERSQYANQLYQQDVSNDLAERQFQEGVRQYNESLKEQARQRSAAAAQQAAFNGLFNAAGPPSAPKQVGAMTRKQNNSGFAFTDAAGKPISAAKYAQLNGADITEVLKAMGQQGDNYAANAYNWFRRTQGMDAYNTPEKLLKAAQRNFGALFWGL